MPVGAAALRFGEVSPRFAGQRLFDVPQTSNGSSLALYEAIVNPAPGGNGARTLFGRMMNALMDEQLVRGFPPTRHSAVALVRSGEAAERARGLKTLSSVYWRPVYSYLRLRWHRPHEEAADLAQEFFADVVEKELLARFDPSRARLRTYLRVCIDGLVANHDKAASRQKRGGGAPPLPFDFEEEIERLNGTGDSPETLVEKAWARGVFALALRRLHEECAGAGKAQRAAVPEPALSQTKYRLAGVAGTGGMGTVYVVEDTELKRRVALKVLDVPDAGIEARLRREAQVLAQLEHPGIVPVHDAGALPDGRAFYTMKWVQGDRLDRRLSRPVPLAERLRLFLRVAEAVAFAHARGVLHRDLKPENVMVGAFGEVLVLDWGLAKVLADAGDPVPARRTGESAVLGTPGFMSPEQRGGESATVDARTDVYSLGAMLQWMAGGDARTLQAISRKAMAARREDRYPDVLSLAAEVTRFLDGEAVSADAESVLRRLARLAKRHRGALGIVRAYLAGRALILLFTGR